MCWDETEITSSRSVFLFECRVLQIDTKKVFFDIALLISINIHSNFKFKINGKFKYHFNYVMHKLSHFKNEIKVYLQIIGSALRQYVSRWDDAS